MNSRRLSHLLYGLVMVTLFALPGCAGQSKPSGEVAYAADGNGRFGTALAIDGDAASPKEGAGERILTFTQYVNYDWYTAPAWEERPHGRWITENLGVRMIPIQSSGSAASKLNAMIVSKQLPDAIVLERGKDVERLVSAGQLVPLDPYLEKYPEFAETIGRANLEMLRSADGKLYQIPNWFIHGLNDSVSGNAAYLINRKIYKQLGSPALDTWSDLEAYLLLVKQAQFGVIPLEFGEIRDSESQMIGMLYSGAANDRNPAFLSPGSGAVFGVPVGKELISIYQDPAFARTAAFASRLYREGYISGDSFTQTRDQMMERLKDGKIAVFGAYDAVVEGVGREANHWLQAKDPDAGYDIIWPIHAEGVDKTKVYPSGYNNLGWNVNVITRNAANPEAIFAYMNWALSKEGQQVFFFGPPGLYYDRIEDGVPLPNKAYINRDRFKYDELKIGEFNWYGNTSYVDAAKSRRERLLPEKAQDWTAMAQTTVSFKTSKNMTEFSNLDPLPNTEEGMIMQQLKEHYKQLVPKIIFAASDEEVSKLIEEAENESQRLGYGKVLQWKTAKWQQNLNLMGKR
ncbi:extracellular solute-binding protein [Paenibacillus paridis]|uniref:extracellular solute-binding protein n=1 Tax=Paenibacillus paridis TaxID=2583376 RepID=UPI001EE4E8E8|nr:extracellular solute-binding protein [Paenibacillus paridis]